MGRARSVQVREELPLRRGGPGFTSFGLRHLPGFSLDPFLSLDDFVMSVPTFPPHPHAGFSAVTYMLESSPGAFTNRDSLGDRSRIGPGAIHWTQAGRGMMHEEIPEHPGTDCHGVQMFVNLGSAHKSAPPRALHADREQIPELVQAGARARVLAGELGGLRSPLEGLLTPVLFLDVHLDAGAELRIPLDPASNAFLLTVAGGGAVGPVALGPHTAVGLAADGDEIDLRGGPKGLELLVCAGRSIGEPVVFGGPFAMTHRDEIEQAHARFERGEMGRLSRSF
jgi:redox-sensitive bicupin YhaK (pirin superfamily)